MSTFGKMFFTKFLLFIHCSYSCGILIKINVKKGKNNMFYEEKMKASVEDFGKGARLTERSILKFLENIGAYHSDRVGYGALDIPQTGISWILLEWKVQILRYPTYGEHFRVKTWSRGVSTPFTTYRDYEIYAENGEKLVIASAKWTAVNVLEKKIEKLTGEMLDRYETEEAHVFEEKEIMRQKEPTSYEAEMTFRARRHEIDLNGHVHNLCYLDYALDILPQEVYETRDFHDIRVTYRKEIKADEEITCKYHGEDGAHIVGIYGGDGKLRAIVYLA